MLGVRNRVLEDAKRREEPEVVFEEGDDEYSDPEMYSYSDEEDVQETLSEIDQKNINNPTKAAKYAQLIITEAVNEEFQSRISLQLFRACQTEVTPHIREIAIRWMIKVHQMLGWTSETLYNAVLFVDISMCQRDIKKVDLQLWLVTCLWVAAKVEEVYPQDVSVLLETVDNCFAVEDLVKCERELLAALRFRVSYPTVKLFLRRLLDCTEAEDGVCEAGYFLCEVSLLEARMLDFGFNVIAACCVALAFRGLGLACPISHIILYGGIEDEANMLECGNLLLEKVNTILNNKSDEIVVRYSHPVLQGAVRTLKFHEGFDVMQNMC